LSFVFLAEMSDALLLDSYSIEVAVSQEAMYVDSAGANVSAFQQDQTVVRAIEEHDFQLRHDASVAVLQGVRWKPV